MIKPGVLLLSLVCLIAVHPDAGYCWEPAKVAKDTFKTEKQAVTYYFYVPKGVSAEALAPMLLLLHGFGRDGRTMIDEWKKLADKEGLVLVAPNAQDRQGWYVPADGPPLTCALLTELHNKLPVIARRTYLFGHSAGAVFGLYLAMLESEYFAAAAVHAGAWRTPDELESASWTERKIPVAMFNGDQDPFFPVEAVRKTEAALKKAGIPTEVEIINNHNHNYYALSGRINQSAWGFLKAHALTEAPKFTEHAFSSR